MPMEIIISILSLIVATFAFILAYIQVRNQIRPNIKIALVHSTEFGDTMQIELSRLPQCYQLRSVSVVCQRKCVILNYGIGTFSQNAPQTIQPSDTIQLGYWINADDSNTPSSLTFWFTVAKSTYKRALRLGFRSVLSPYFSGCELPVVSRTNDII